MHELHRDGASFSPDRLYRYKLWRGLGDSARGAFVKPLVVIGLNPSTADEMNDDPTIRRLRAFATREGFDKLIMLNLFAFRATEPNNMKIAADPVGPFNDSVIESTCKDRTVLCAWGVHGKFKNRAEAVMKLLRAVEAKPVCLGKTKAGDPKHPLYLASETKFQVYGVSS